MGAQGSKPSLTVEEQEDNNKSNDDIKKESPTGHKHDESSGTRNDKREDGGTGTGTGTGGKRQKKPNSEDEFPALVYYFYATLQMYIPIEDVRVAPPKQEKKEKTTT
jgi:hypothetical protein